MWVSRTQMPRLPFLPPTSRRPLEAGGEGSRVLDHVSLAFIVRRSPGVGRRESKFSHRLAANAICPSQDLPSGAWLPHV